MFSESVCVTDSIGISYIAKYTCDNSVMVPMYELALKTPCNVYSLLVLFEIKSKL